MKKPKNRVINFEISSFCNYNCSYCIGVKEKEIELVSDKIPYNSRKVKELLKNTLTKLKNSWIFNIGGPGEPFLIPDFLEIIKEIIKNKHKINVVTNFSASEEEILKFCKITKEQLIRLDATLHLDRAKLNEFFKKAVLINKKIGRDRFSVVSVARKGKVFQLEKIGRRFRRRGIIFTMQLEKNFKGKNRGYVDYSKKELEVIRNFRKSSKNKKRRKLTGKLCWSGCQYFIVDQRGECWHCHSAKRMKNRNGYLGNLIEKTFKLKKNASLCPYKYCLCITPIVFNLVEKSEE